MTDVDIITPTLKSKMVPGKDLLDPALVKTMPEGTNRLRLGVIAGVITGFIERTMPTGETYEGFKGNFAANPDMWDGKVIKPPVRSGVCYLPGGFFEKLAQEFRDANPEPKGGETKQAVQPMKFAFLCESVKAGNPAGYEWAYTPLIAPTVQDPLASVMAEASQHKVLAAKPAAAQIEAPKPAAASKK